MANIFFTNFDSSVKREKDLKNSEVRKLISSGKLELNQVQLFKNDHPVALKYTPI